MANWIQVPGGPVVNFDTVTSMQLQGTTIVLQTTAGPQTLAFSSIAAAGSAFKTLNDGIASSVPGGATIVSISPNSIAAGDSGTLTLTGTNFLPSANITVGGLNITPAITYLNGTTISIFWESEDGTFLGAGTYDVVYSDAAGGSATLHNGFTVT